MDFDDVHPVDKQRLLELRDALRALPDPQAQRDARILVGVLARRFRDGDDSQLAALIGHLRVTAGTTPRAEFPQLALNIIIGAKAKAA